MSCRRRRRVSHRFRLWKDCFIDLKRPFEMLGSKVAEVPNPAIRSDGKLHTNTRIPDWLR